MTSHLGNPAQWLNVQPQPAPFVYSLRLDQYLVANTRSPSTDTNTVGYTVGIGSQSYTQTLPPTDAGDGNHDVCLEFDGIQGMDAGTPVTVSLAIVNAGHNAQKVEDAFVNGVDKLITLTGKELGGTFGSEWVIDAAILAINEVMALLFANCDGTVAADKLATTFALLEAQFPTGGCVATNTAHYPGTDSATGCGANSDYYVSHTITRVRQGSATEPVAGRGFIIAGRSSGLVIDVPGGSHEPGVQVQQWPDNGTASQHWAFEPVDVGYFLIRSQLNGLVLEIAGDSHDDHAAVQQAIETGATRQHWAIEEVSVPPPQLIVPVFRTSRYFRIRSRVSGKVLDVRGHSADRGVKLWQYGAKSSDYNNQLWQLLELPTVSPETIGTQQVPEQEIIFHDGSPSLPGHTPSKGASGWHVSAERQ